MPAPPVQPMDAPAWPCWSRRDRKSTRLNSSHTVIYTLSLHDALPILTLIGASMLWVGWFGFNAGSAGAADGRAGMAMLVTQRSEEHTSELQSHRDLHSFPTRRSSDLDLDRRFDAVGGLVRLQCRLRRCSRWTRRHGHAGHA